MLIKNSDYDLPIKILIPFFASFPIPGQCSAIGISDLIVPGIFIAFGAVYDKKTGSKYFHVLTFLYFTSLFVAVSVDVVFSKIQPAMLYIAPILICGMGLCAVYRKEFWKIWLGELGKPLMQSEVAMKNLSNL
jgi:membrane associated rhomboid family serine protease